MVSTKGKMRLRSLLQKMKQEYRHTKPYRGKDPFFEYEEIEEYKKEASNKKNKKEKQNGANLGLRHNSY
jgi:hypothetical protein